MENTIISEVRPPAARALELLEQTIALWRNRHPVADVRPTIDQQRSHGASGGSATRPKKHELR